MSFYNLVGNVHPRVVVERGTDWHLAEERGHYLALWDAFPESLNISAPQPVQPLPSRRRQWCLEPSCPHFRPRDQQRDMTATRTIYNVNANILEEKINSNTQTAARGKATA